PERKSSPGVMASPGQPFWAGPSTTKCWVRALQSTRPKVSVERAWISYCRTACCVIVSSPPHVYERVHQSHCSGGSASVRPRFESWLVVPVSSFWFIDGSVVFLVGKLYIYCCVPMLWLLGRRECS